MFPLVRDAVESILPVMQLRYIGFSHVEADECGSLNEWLAAAEQSVPLCGRVAAMVSIEDLADRSPRALADGETLSLGRPSVQWFDAPHLPRITEADILGPSEAFRHKMDYFSHTKYADAMLERLAATKPDTLACMHGSAWRGDGAALLRALARSLSG